MTRKQAEYLASFERDYIPRCVNGNWIVWSLKSDHVVEYDRLPPVDHYGEVMRNRRYW